MNDDGSDGDLSYEVLQQERQLLLLRKTFKGKAK